MTGINILPMVSKKAIVTALAMLAASVFLSNTFLTQKAHAAYEGGDLIDNSVFLNAASMSKEDIQSFLAGKGAGLANLYFTLDCDVAGAQAKSIYQSVGAPCGQSVRASHIIYYAAQIYGINPQVLLATMQKEQSLTTAANPTSWQLNQAMGYGCPTSGGCGASTFFYQVDNGAWVMRFHYERARGNMSWWYTSSSWTCGTEKAYYKPNLYPGQNVRFHDEDGVHYRTLYLENAATSSLYCYTPHAYNNPNGLYGLPTFGTNGRYYTGSYNFVKFFELWFGSTRGNEIGASIYRMFHPGKVTHLYTARENERAHAKVNGGYKDDGKDVFKIVSTPEPGTIPIYNLWHGALHDNWLVPDGPVFYWGLVHAGYANKGIAFYAYPVNINSSPGNPVCPTGTVGVRQMWHGGFTEHFYSVNGWDHTWALLDGGYENDGSSIYKDGNGGISFCVPA